MNREFFKLNRLIFLYSNSKDKYMQSYYKKLIKISLYKMDKYINLNTNKENKRVNLNKEINSRDRFVKEEKEGDFSKCPIIKSKKMLARNLREIVLKETINGWDKTNLIWLETSGCSGNIISILNGEYPSVDYFIKNMVNMTYSNTLMQEEGEKAFEKFLNTLDKEFILAVEGAISTKDNGLYNIIANYKGQRITGLDAVKMAGEKAKYIIAFGTCASFGGISSANPNPGNCKSVSEILKDREVINVPGCPAHPDWMIGTVASILLFGKPELDNKNRPVIFYGSTVHDFCTRRSFFDNKQFATHLGDEKGCFIKLGCKGPITLVDCPNRRWNPHINWPIGDNTPCIGCAGEGFPDKVMPFLNI